MVQKITVPTPAQPIGGGDMQGAFTALEAAINAQFLNAPGLQLNALKKTTATQALVLTGGLNLLNTSAAQAFSLPLPNTLLASGVAQEILVCDISGTSVANTIVGTSTTIRIVGAQTNNSSSPGITGTSIGRTKVTFQHKYQMLGLIPISSFQYQLSRNIGAVKAS